MEVTWLILVTSTCLPLREEEEGGGAEAEAGLLRNQRMAKKPTMATARIWGMLIEVWLSAILTDGCVSLAQEREMVVSLDPLRCVLV